VPSLHNQLQRWQEDLINLGKENSLLHYVSTKTSTIEIDQSDPSTLIQRLEALSTEAPPSSIRKTLDLPGPPRSRLEESSPRPSEPSGSSTRGLPSSSEPGDVRPLYAPSHARKRNPEAHCVV
jgi:hypothetical protein